MPTSQPSVLAVTKRGGLVECEHWGAVAICDTQGKLVESIGSPSLPTFMRSSAKPIQAATAISLGTADHFQWTDAELAVVCASHTGEPRHLATVRAILARAAVSPAFLKTTPHPPNNEAARDEFIRARRAATEISSNCSGKHAGMLATCRLQDWPLETYQDPNHPLQKAILARLIRLSGIRETEIGIGVDGCCVPTFHLTLAGMATAFARLAHNDADGIRATRAMMAEPWMVSGTQRLDQSLMGFAKGRIASKGGAEGLLCFALPEAGLGVAIKALDGNARCFPRLLARILPRYLPDLDWTAWAEKIDPPIKDRWGRRSAWIE